MAVGESAAALFSGRPRWSMTHLTMAMRTWKETIIRTGGSDATTQRQTVSGSLRPPSRKACATLKAMVPTPHSSMVVLGQPLGDFVGAGDGAHDPAEDRGQLGDNERDIEHAGERLGDPGAVQAEHLDQAVDRVPARGAGQRGDSEDAGGHGDDDEPANSRQVAE